ncbi:hypothetical protein FBU59_001984 [Linderina macrospora]|uniref:Uncharacterized protein n=1 Tax=Linderina macrospora TaxID=4868 RepID=A0ACC1JCT5_9FUNG|nr:hypothetical protein FBU59_001984 [Linderina macrospora]
MQLFSPVFLASIYAAATTASASPAFAERDQSSSQVATTYNTPVSQYNFDDASYNYCQATYPSAQSYSSVPDATLEMVQVVVRHGDRTSYVVLPNENETWNCDGVEENTYLHVTGSSSRNTTGSFKQVIEIPKWNSKYGFSNQVWAGSCDIGELTDIGKAQHRKLGKQLREIYVNKINFLPPWLKDTSSVYFRTTYIWRTKNSGESLIGSLYPGRDIGSDDAIPMHTYPQSIETMIDNPTACPKLNTYSAQIYGSAPFQQFLKDQGPLMSRISGILGVSGPMWTASWSGYVDALLPRKCHSKPLPCRYVNGQKTTDCVTEEDVKQAMRNGSFEWTFKYRDHPLSGDYARLAIGSFLATLRDQIQDHVSGAASGPKFSLYSGHDTTVAALLGALKASNADMLWPPYASNLVFETWKKKDGSYVVRIVSNGHVLQLQDGQKWCDLSSCPLDSFNKYLATLIPTDIAAQCANN